MIFRFVLVCLVAASLLMLSLALQQPSPAYYQRCLDIGTSSGCSGCNNVTTGCEWCSHPDDESALPPTLRSSCAPKEFCSGLPQLNGKAFHKADIHICPSDPANEKTLGGKDISPKNAQRFSPSVDSHYCEFAQEPHTIDRCTNIIL
jgi:hypothetical protein